MMEIQILEIKKNEEKLKKENFLYQRQLNQYKDHLNFELASRNKHFINTESRQVEKLTTKDKLSKTNEKEIRDEKKNIFFEVNNTGSSLLENSFEKKSSLNVISKINDSTIFDDVPAETIKSQDQTLKNVPRHSSNYGNLIYMLYFI